MKKHNKIVMLTRSKLKSTGIKISEALINNEISHEDVMTIINKERNYWELKKALEWRKFEKVTLKKSIWLKKVKK